MPYVEMKIRDSLDPLILCLHRKIISMLSGWGTTDAVECTAWGYMRYVAFKVLEETGLNAAEQYQGKRGTRYWLVVDYAGIPVNIALELFDRIWAVDGEELSIDWVVLRPSPVAYEFHDDVKELDAEISGLVSQISKNAGPEGYNYDGAYNGLVNYSMSELMPRILKSVRDIQDRKFTRGDVKMLIEFWFDVMIEIYNPRVARRYENEQRERNRDIKAYGEILEWLKE